MSVLVTRPQGETDRLVVRLRELGHRVHAVPTVATEPIAFAPPDLAGYDWVVVTSASGVRHLLGAAAPAARPRWAAVGPATAAELERFGLRVAALPAVGRGREVAAAIEAVQPLRGLRLLLARADAAAPDLPAALRAAGAHAEELAVYHTVEGPPSSLGRLLQALRDPALALVVFASGSAVRGLIRLLEMAAGAGPPRRVRDLPAVTIGAATAEVARGAGFGVQAEAARPAVEDLVAAVRRVLARGGNPSSSGSDATASFR